MESWGVNSGLPGLLILSTFHYPVCFPHNSFLPTTGKLQILSNKLGPLWQGPRTFLQYEGFQNAHFTSRVTFPPHIFKPVTSEPFLSPVATPGTGSAYSTEWRWRRARAPEKCGRGRQVWWALPSAGLLRAQPIPAPLNSTRPCQGRPRRCAPVVDTKELPNTALQRLKMQHPKQGLKMQSWGWAVRRDVVQTTAAPKQHPPPSLRSPWGPERLKQPGEQMRRVLRLPSTSAPSHLPPPLTPPAAEARATGAGGSQALTFVTVMQELRGAAGARARRAGAAVGVRWGPGRQREGVPAAWRARGPGGSGRSPAPRGRLS